MAARCNSLADSDAAYIAGLIDGEGTITLSRRHARDQRQVVVSIASTERVLLEFVLVTVGAGKITGKRTTSALHAPSFAYCVSNRQALRLLEQITKYLRSYKRTRAEMLLESYVSLTPRNGKYSAEKALERKVFEDAFLEIRANGKKSSV